MKPAGGSAHGSWLGLPFGSAAGHPQLAYALTSGRLVRRLRLRGRHLLTHRRPTRRSYLQKPLLHANADRQDAVWKGGLV